MLGIEKAVFAGHSMGGRMAIRLAAIAPERALALVLFDAAAGASFDTAVATALKSPRRALQTAVDMAMDTRSDPPLKGERVSYLRTLASVALRNKPAGVSGAARAIVGSGPYTPLLHVIRDRGVPMMILHGEHDRIVPFDAAVDMADDADGTLYRVPGAYHSWMLANPRHGSDALRQLLDGDLGLALRHEADQLGIGDWRDAAAWDRVLVRPDASVRGLGGDEVIERDPDPPRRVELELVRCADGPRSVKRMPWMRRTYRRWSARYSGLARTSAS